MARFPTITAHTGCDGSVPNTISSAILGFELGAEFVEVDVRTTADGALVLAHDDLFRGSLLSVQRSGLASLSRPRESGLLPTLHELFDSIPRDGRVNLDLKDDRAVSLVVELVARRGAQDRVLLTGCSAERARAALSLDPGFPVYLNTGFGTGDEGRAPDPRSCELECEFARELGCCGLNVAHRLCTPYLVEAARRRGLSVSVWTVEPADGYERFVELGVANITTRSVAELVRFRDSRE